jgi:sugar (pentulose or hexulose) kinase
MLQPYWSPGLKVPGPEAMGAVIGFTDVHTRAHLYRAILEGLAYGLREGKERLEKRRIGTPITELRISGGGSQSDAAMQLTADIFGLPAIRPHVYETSGLGAAIDAAVGLKLHPDFATAVREMTRPGRIFDPESPHARNVRRTLPARLSPALCAAQAVLQGYSRDCGAVKVGKQEVDGAEKIVALSPLPPRSPNRCRVVARHW